MQDTGLFGRIAVHNKVLTKEQLAECVTIQGMQPDKKLGDIAVELGFITEDHKKAILKAQRQFLAQKAKEASARIKDEFDDDFDVAEESAPKQAKPDTSVVTSGNIEGAISPILISWLKSAVKTNASDLHLQCSLPPYFRIGGKVTLTKSDPLTPDALLPILESAMNEEQLGHFREHHDVDFAFEVLGLSRFRVNIFKERKGPAANFRVIASAPPSLTSLGLPTSLAKFTNFHQGLVLVTGPARCGKSTTLTALINLINEERRHNILTLEDPIEFVHKSKMANVIQRQVPDHTNSFASAMRAALREDPDVIMIGEMRDLEAISLAISASETGHLVLGTLHTYNAPRTIERLIGTFPPGQQTQIRAMISESLRGVISQHLIPRADNQGLVPAIEVMFNAPAIANLIRENKCFQLPGVMQTGKKLGQKLLDESLRELVSSKTVTLDAAKMVSPQLKIY
ncbi:MAG: PilT/PilU family type 4a pilus ATPase [Planctomycetes bacterium]|nr:PilT/PilU family type 4a pilus ATPase [Planctomycetota bacterium]